MAIGQFANISRYVGQPSEDRLGAAFEAAGQFYQLPQQLQQQQQLAQQQQVAQQIAAQLQQLTLAERQAKLADLQNPGLAIQRQFQQELLAQSLRPETGIRRAGVGEAPVGAIEPIFGPLGEETPYVRDVERASAGRAALQRASRSAPFQFVGLTTNPEGTTQGAVFNPERGVIESRPLPEGVSEIGPKVTRPRPPKSILATNDETGRVTHIALAPGEELPEGFSTITKKAAEDYKSIDAFRKEISRNPTIKQFMDVQKSKQRIDVAMAESLVTKNFLVVDQALISSFNRLLEPDSVTMVSEYLRTSQDAPLINRLTAGLTRPISGGRLDQKDREALARLSERIYQTSLGNYSRTVDYFEGIGERRGWETADFIQPIAEEAPTTTPVTAPVTSPVGTTGINSTAPAPVVQPRLIIRRVSP